MSHTRRSIAHLDALVAALSEADRARFARIFHLDVTTGQVVPPAGMEDWIVAHFGAVEAVRRQRIVKVTNRYTLEGALFNELRSGRPHEAPPGDDDLEETIRRTRGGPFCRPEEGTPADLFGRIRGRSSITASNIAKYDGWHGVIIFDEHHPLRFTAEEVADYLHTAQRWAQAAHEREPAACYPFFLWNCLWRSGASILHGHAQMTLTRGMAYGRVEAWRRAALRYRRETGCDYFDDLLAVHRALGLAVDHGTATIVASLTPCKEKETWIVGRRWNDDLPAALYRVLRTMLGRWGVQSFNIALYQPPLAATPEDWTGFPFIFRILDRGNLRSRHSDVGAMEFFAQSVIAADPFRVADAWRAPSGPERPR